VLFSRSTFGFSFTPAGPLHAAPMKFQSRLTAGAAVAVVVMCITAAVPPVSLSWVNETRQAREVVDRQVQSLHRIESLAVDAETGQRGYIVTGRDDFLEPYNIAMAELPAEISRLESRYEGESAESRESVVRIVASTRRKLADLQRNIELRRHEGFQAAQQSVNTGNGKRYMDEVRRHIDGLIATEADELARIDAELTRKAIWAIAVSLGSTLLTFALLFYLGRVIASSMRERDRAARQLRTTSAQLEDGLARLQRRNDEVTTLGEMSRVLQTEMSLVEALEVTSLFCQRLLPATSGAVYLFRNSADVLEHAGAWGDGVATPDAMMEPSSCWGLRRGQTHICKGPSELRCRHYADSALAGFHVCLPLTAYGEVLGQLHVWSDDPAAKDSATTTASMAQTIAEQVALSLSNAKLRQVLRDQSIKDPLTGLYNRRYMEETLARELLRAQRSQKPLSVMVVDLDYFKKVNDTHGHAAGDAVLKGLSQCLQGAVRASDIACRLGGEEFLLILPDCTREDAMHKAEELRARVGSLTFREAVNAVRVTASFGVASFPADGSTAALVVDAADAALYQAKRSGRNRAVAAGQLVADETARTFAETTR
jgi:diguanylate cyclase (GGDEF)-like protein